jgi:formamidopyrimidine-DNA glycosylase
MPELPEVETVVRVLKKTWPLFPIEKIDVFFEKMITPSFNVLEKNLIGATLVEIERIGKHIIFIFNQGTVIISHLRMEGKYFLLQSEDPLPRFARLVLHFSNHQRIVYDDMRKFGTWTVTTKDDYKSHPSLKKLGIEPFDVKDTSSLYLKFKQRTQAIKTVLLDQSLLLGIGNIYADEILYASRLHPLTPSSTLKQKDIDTLIAEAKRILNTAIDAGGSYVRSYRAGDSIDGSFQLQLHAYNKDAFPCDRCGFLMKKITVNGRGTTYCPRCQKLDRPTTLIAITGPIASGKSLVLEMIKKQGYPVISSDIIVKQFYAKKQYHPLLKNIFGPAVMVQRTVDTTFILQQCMKHPSRLRQLEGLIHPFVERQIIKAFKTTKGRYLFVEVPLLFQARLDYLADHILFIKVNATLQSNRVLLRNKEKGPFLLLLNEKKYQKDYAQYADTVIVNDESVESFSLKINDWLQTVTKDQTLGEAQSL